MGMEEMGYQNANLVYALSSIGRLNKPRGGKLAVNTMAIATLTYMALNTYDWLPRRSCVKRICLAAITRSAGEPSMTRSAWGCSARTGIRR